jgi:hypothetical protein
MTIEELMKKSHHDLQVLQSTFDDLVNGINPVANLYYFLTEDDVALNQAKNEILLNPKNINKLADCLCTTKLPEKSSSSNTLCIIPDRTLEKLAKLKFEKKYEPIRKAIIERLKNREANPEILADVIVDYHRKKATYFSNIVGKFKTATRKQIDALKPGFLSKLFSSCFKTSSDRTTEDAEKNQEKQGWFSWFFLKCFGGSSTSDQSSTIVQSTTSSTKEVILTLDGDILSTDIKKQALNEKRARFEQTETTEVISDTKTLSQYEANKAVKLEIEADLKRNSALSDETYELSNTALEKELENVTRRNTLNNRNYMASC